MKIHLSRVIINLEQVLVKILSMCELATRLSLGLCGPGRLADDDGFKDAKGVNVTTTHFPLQTGKYI